MADGMIEVARATVTLVPNMAGSQGEITSQLTGVARQASQEAGNESGRSFGDSFANALGASAAAISAALAAATAAAVATGAAFLSASNDIAELGNQIDKESQKMNMSATAYQEWDFILQHAGSSIDGMKTSMRKLTTAAEEGNAAFDALGISQADLANMSPEETWNATIAALQNVEDESERTVLASQLLGRGATELAPLFNMTAEETEAMRQQVHDLGGVMSDEAVAAAAEYEDELQNMKTSLRGLKASMMQQFLPGLTQVMEGLAGVFSGNGGIEQIREGLNSVTTSLTELAPQFFEIANTLVMSLISGFAPMLPSLTTAIFDFIDQGIVTFTRMVPQLTPVITTGVQRVGRALFNSLPVLLRGLIEMTQEIVTWLASGDNVGILVDGIMQLCAILAESMADALPILLPAIVNIVSQIAQSLTDPQNLGMILNAVLLVVGAVVVALTNSLPEIGGLIVETLRNLGQIVTNFLSAVVPNVSAGIELVVNLVRNFKNAVTNTIVNLVNNVQTRVSNWLTNIRNSFTNAFNTIRERVSNVVSSIRGFVDRCVTTLQSLPSQVVTIGKNLVIGLWNGITNKVDWVVTKIQGMGTRITNAIKSVFGIASPSKVWAAQIGQYLPLGLYEGYTDSMEDVEDQIISDMNGLTADMSATVQANGVQGAAVLDNGDNVNMGNISINIYPTEGMNAKDIADMVGMRLEEMTRRRSAVYA